MAARSLPLALVEGDPVDVATGLVTPWSVAFVGDSALISQRNTGDILELVDDTTRVVGTVPDVVQQGESGLLGIAVDESDRLYAYSTGPDGNRIDRRRDVQLNIDVFGFELDAAELTAIDTLDHGVRGGPDPDEVDPSTWNLDIPEA